MYDFSKYSLVRLTQREFNQVLHKQTGEKFVHINLQHSNPPSDLLGSSTYLVVCIQASGINKSNVKLDPVLDYSAPIPVRLINIKHSIPIADLVGQKLATTKGLILHSDKGVLVSLVEKYGSVMGLSEKDILKMECYVREFEIL